MPNNKTALRTWQRNTLPVESAERLKRGTLELARDAVDNITRNGKLCLNDTDGDGDCGRPLCPVCGRYRKSKP